MDQSVTPAQPKEFSFSRGFLNIGFIFGLLLAGFCLYLAADYMNQYAEVSSKSVNQVVDHTMGKLKGQPEQTKMDYQMIRLALTTNMYIARVLLLSCGMFIGLAFGFLGFSLFLIGVKGNVDTTIEGGASYKLQMARLSPGLFVILCAAIIIGICITRNLPVNLNQKTTTTSEYVQDDLPATLPDSTAVNQPLGLDSADSTMPQ
ncbi:MAG: hypothetical protein V4687_16760 [Bacteroidota bacterium]